MKVILLSSMLAIVFGSVVILNGVATSADSVIAGAYAAVNSVNTHQLETALELYYLDHSEYPNVKGGKALVELLRKEEYIRNYPLDPTIFNYNSLGNGQDYSLVLEQK